MNTYKLDHFDPWLTSDSIFAALTVRQWLVPVEGPEAVIFPPTYAAPEGMRKEDWLGYSIDTIRRGRENGEAKTYKICQIDSVGSQANRMEPVFMFGEYAGLVPQIKVKAGETTVNLLEAGHRAADAIVRFTDTLAQPLWDAFKEWKDKGNAKPLAQMAPTSIIFGVWDSRATQAKVPRILRSVIRAYDVEELHRSAQYTTIAGEIVEGGDAEVTAKGPKAELGLAHVPAVNTHGGVRVYGEIRKDALLNLASLRKLGCGPDSDERDDLFLRRYILGVALVALSAPQDITLRQGCELVPDEMKAAEWQTVRFDGHRDPCPVDHDAALSYAKLAAEQFPRSEDVQAQFQADQVRMLESMPEKARKAQLRSGPIVNAKGTANKKKGA